MRVIFLGTPAFALPSLAALVASEHEIIAVVTQPDRPKGRGRGVEYSPIKQFAIERGVRVLQYENIRTDEAVNELTALNADAMITAAYGQILSKKVLAIPPKGVINLHASLLPRHRGAAPIAWAIAMGDSVTGVTTMYTARGVDTGDMIFVDETPIAPEDDAESLSARLAQMGAKVLIRTLYAVVNGTAPRTPQDERFATYEPMLTRETGLIDFVLSASDIARRVRGFSPWPGAYARLNGNVMKVMRVNVTKGSGTPGMVLVADAKRGLVVACGESAIEIIELQMPGKRRMSAVDYLRGQVIEVGTVLNHDS